MTRSTELSTKREIIHAAEERVSSLLAEGGLVLPTNYAWQNALKSAWLTLQDATIQSGQNSGRKILDVVTQGSVANALLDMVVQGLNVGAKQGYFIPYGQTLTFRRSYFGSIAVAKRVAAVREVRALPIYQDDKLELEVEDGLRRIVSHRQTFGAIREGTIVGAYAIVKFTTDRPDVVDVMTIEEIRTSWAKAKGGSVHKDFPEAMALRTVIQRALKPIINAASDDYLFLDAYNREPENALEADLDELEGLADEPVDVDLPDAPALERSPDDEVGEVVDAEYTPSATEPEPAPEEDKLEPAPEPDPEPAPSTVSKATPPAFDPYARPTPPAKKSDAELEEEFPAELPF